MYLQKEISRKSEIKNIFCYGVFKIRDENGRIRIGIYW